MEILDWISQFKPCIRSLLRARSSIGKAFAMSAENVMTNQLAVTHMLNSQANGQSNFIMRFQKTAFDSTTAARAIVDNRIEPFHSLAQLSLILFESLSGRTLCRDQSDFYVGVCLTSMRVGSGLGIADMSDRVQGCFSAEKSVSPTAIPTISPRCMTAVGSQVCSTTARSWEIFRRTSLILGFYQTL
jgi:hypothetical protein